jgi:uncharacterized protein
LSAITRPAPHPAAPWHCVLDTNVVMALWHFRDPKLQRLWDWIETGAVRPVTRSDCLDELQRVLAYSQFRIEAEQREHLYAAYAALAHCLPDADEAQIAFAESLPRCGDRDDQKFVSLAWDAGARALVTRDKLLLRLARRAPLKERFVILTPEHMCQQAEG